MPRTTRPTVKFADLPLFVWCDRDLAEAVVGPDPVRKAVWLAGIPSLERCGFPKSTPGHGRYKPAVKAFYDRLYSFDSPKPMPNEPPVDDAAWNRRRRPRGRS